MQQLIQPNPNKEVVNITAFIKLLIYVGRDAINDKMRKEKRHRKNRQINAQWNPPTKQPAKQHHSRIGKTMQDQNGSMF